MSWDWLDEEHDELRAQLRTAEPFYSADPIPAVKILSKERSEDLVADAPGHWWTASCRARQYRRSEMLRPSPQHRRAPDLDCSCGFYAFKSLEELTWVDRRWATQAKFEGEWAGLWYVELAGVVFEHEYGFRAEKLRLVSKWQPRDAVEVLHELGSATTGQIRQASGYWSGNDAVLVRTALKAAARRGECVEIRTANPHSYGGHLWVSTGSLPRNEHYAEASEQEKQ